jgi:hypothetical protein
MSPTNEAVMDAIHAMRDQLSRFEARVLGEDGDGRLPVAEGRLNNHAWRIRILEMYALLIAGGAIAVGYIINNLSKAVALAHNMGAK